MHSGLALYVENRGDDEKLFFAKFRIGIARERELFWIMHWSLQRLDDDISWTIHKDFSCDIRLIARVTGVVGVNGKSDGVQVILDW